MPFNVIKTKIITLALRFYMIFLAKIIFHIISNILFHNSQKRAGGEGYCFILGLVGEDGFGPTRVIFKINLFQHKGRLHELKCHITHRYTTHATQEMN